MPNTPRCRFRIDVRRFSIEVESDDADFATKLFREGIDMCLGVQFGYYRKQLQKDIICILSRIIQQKELRTVTNGNSPARWTPDEDRQLKELREVKKLKWRQIAELLNNGKSARACETHYSRYVKGQ